jgi:hypothetical protein
VSRAGEDGSKRPHQSRRGRARFVDIDVALRGSAVRRFLGMGTIAWTAFVVTDVIAARVHSTSLATWSRSA